MASVEELRAQLTIIDEQISYVLNNSHLAFIEVQTQYGRTLVKHGDSTKTLELLSSWKKNTFAELASLEGVDSGPVDFSKTPMSIPLVFMGRR
jgi:hypothetical protein